MGSEQALASQGSLRLSTLGQSTPDASSQEKAQIVDVSQEMWD